MDDNRSVAHPSDMRAWTTISCQAGHDSHATRNVDLVLCGQTPYHDYAPIPEHLATAFTLNVWDYESYADETVYCPAHDAVSETLATLGVWEPCETSLLLHAFKHAPRGSRFLDFGAQIGYFSTLAAVSGIRTLAFEADSECAELIADNARLNHADELVTVVNVRVDGDTAPLALAAPVRVLKIDLEGAENHAIRVCQPLLLAGLVDYVLMEVSPCFDSYYPDLMVDLRDMGYIPHLTPPKRIPPHLLESPLDDVKMFKLDYTDANLRAEVASWDQANVWLVREGL